MRRTPDSHRVFWPAALSAAAATVTAWLFWPSHRFGFLDWDDAGTLLRQSAYQGFSLQNFHWMFTTHHMGPYQPLAWLSFAINYVFWGLRPGAYHLTNVFIHAANAGLFALLAMRLLPTAASDADAEAGFQWRAAVILWTAFAYALHPLRVESVAWVTERRDVLCGLFFLISVLAYLRQADDPRGRRFQAYYALSLVAGACAMLSKGIAVGLPMVLWLLDRGWLRRGWADWKSKIPFFVIAGLISWLNLAGFRTGDLPHPPYSLLAKAAFCGNSIRFYAWKTIWPAGLSPYYQTPPDAGFWATGILGGAGAGGLLCLIWMAFGRRWPALWWTLGAYLALLAPVSGLFPNGRFMVADRYSYLAGMPLTLLAGAALWRIGQRSSRPLLIVLMVLSVVTLGGASRRQLDFWKNDGTLWSRAVLVTPTGDLAWYNLATFYMHQGKPELARPFFVEALARAPDSADTHYNFGLLEEMEQYWESAAGHYETALRKQPENRTLRHQLALVHLKSGHTEQAIRELKALVHSAPDFAEASFNLGMIYWETGRKDLAQPLLQKAIHQQPALAGRLGSKIRHGVVKDGVANGT